MLIAAASSTNLWNALSAVGSLASALGTFVAAVVAIWIWRSDRAARRLDREADARALARQLLTEVQTVCALTHTLNSYLPKTSTEQAELLRRYEPDPKGLANRLEIGARIVTTRLERLSEKLGILPAKTTDAITLFMGSALGLSNMLTSLRESGKTDAESILEVLNAIRVLHADAIALYIALAEATGMGADKLKAVTDGLRSIPPA